MQNTFASFSFGCRVNQAEKEMLDRKLQEIGFQYSDNIPDIYIINTCAVTKKAEREARQLIYQTRRKWPKTKIIVTGCAATKWINEKTMIPKSDLLIDNLNKDYIAQLISDRFKSKIQNPKFQSNPKFKNDNSDELLSNVKFSKIAYGIHVPNKIVERPIDILLNDINNNAVMESGYFAGKKILHASNSSNKFLNSGRLLLKIQDGCQRFCTFCIVPYLRGQPKSERIKNLELRIKNDEQDIKEVILTAINTQAYGYDTGETFTELIETILKKTEIERLSFGSVHPWSINRDFIKLYEKYKNNNRLVKFLHIPLQSGSNKILTLMKRGYTRDEFMEKLNQLEKIYPLTFFGTDIITGFLEETDSDFEDTYNFLKDSPISKFHVFRFSRREKTAAYFMSKKMKEPTPAQKSKRANALLELSNKKYQQFLRKHIGKTFPALTLERRIKGFQEALLNNQVPVLIKSNQKVTGEIIDVQVTNYRKGLLTGVLHR